jgi:hypothetical protein
MKPERQQGPFAASQAQLQAPPPPPAVAQAYTQRPAFAQPRSQPNPFEVAVRYHTERIAQMLVQKNADYGNSVFEGVEIFTQGQHQLHKIGVRIDDKLSRIKNGKIDGGEDTIDDLIGYLIIFQIARNGGPT